MLDGVSAIAVIVIASFAIDRIVTGLLFLMSYRRKWAEAFADPKAVRETGQRHRVEKNRKLAYFILAGVLSLPILAGVGHVRIFHALSFTEIPALLDIVVTGLIFVGGSDRMSALLSTLGNMPAAGSSGSQAAPVEITGKLKIEEETGRRTLPNARRWA